MTPTKQLQIPERHVVICPHCRMAVTLHSHPAYSTKHGLAGIVGIHHNKAQQKHCRGSLLPIESARRG